MIAFIPSKLKTTRSSEIGKIPVIFSGYMQYLMRSVKSGFHSSAVLLLVVKRTPSLKATRWEQTLSSISLKLTFFFSALSSPLEESHAVIRACSSSCVITYIVSPLIENTIFNTKESPTEYLFTATFSRESALIISLLGWLSKTYCLLSTNKNHELQRILETSRHFVTEEVSAESPNKIGGESWKANVAGLKSSETLSLSSLFTV